MAKFERPHSLKEHQKMLMISVSFSRMSRPRFQNNVFKAYEGLQKQSPSSNCQPGLCSFILKYEIIMNLQHSFFFLYNIGLLWMCK